MSDLVPELLDYPIRFGGRPTSTVGVNINDNRAADGTRLTADDNDRRCTRVMRFDASRLQYRDQREGLHLLTGGDLGVATRVFRFISLVGEIRDVTPAAVHDRESQLLRLFDLQEAQVRSPTTTGVMWLDFWTPTAQPPDGFTSPVHEFYNCRPSVYPQIFDRQNQGLSVMWATELICPDPNRYLWTRTETSATAANGWEVELPNWDAAAQMGATTWPVISVVTAAGAHSSSLQLRITVGASRQDPDPRHQPLRLRRRPFHRHRHVHQGHPARRPDRRHHPGHHRRQPPGGRTVVGGGHLLGHPRGGRRVRHRGGHRQPVSHATVYYHQSRS